MTLIVSIIKRRGVQLLLLTVAAASAMYARTAISPLQEAMRTALGLTDNQIALLQGPALFLPMMLAAIPMGLLIDRYSRVRLILIFALLNLAGSTLTAMSSDILMLFFSRSLVGLSATVISLTAFSVIADLYNAPQRGRATMAVVIGQYGGMSAAFALGGAFLVLNSAQDGSWRSAMFAMAAVLVPFALLSLTLREPQRTNMRIVKPSVREALSEAWDYRGIILPLLISLALADMAITAIMTWAGPALLRSFAISPDRVGMIMAMTMLMGGVLGPIGGGFVADWCQRRGGPRRTMLALAGIAALGVPMSFFAMAPTIQQASVLLVIFSILIGAMLVSGVTVFTVVIPNELRGFSLSLLAGSQTLMGALAPIAVSLLSGSMSGPAAIASGLALVCATASLLSAAAFLLARNEVWRRQGGQP